MRTALLVFAAALLTVAHAAAKEETASIYESSAEVKPNGPLDRIVLGKLKSLGIEPKLCSDAVFVRRAYLDVIGTLPTAKEARAFIDNPFSPDKKRIALINRLLERKEFADYWSMRWGDVLRIKAEFPINLWPNAAQAYHRWIRASIVENKPYDQFVREMLTASGSNFRVGPVNFYRAVQNKTPEGLAKVTALTFMGARIESWPEDRQEGMAAFFSQVGYKPTGEWKEESVFWDPLKVSTLPTSIAPGRPKPGTAERVVDGESKTNVPTAIADMPQRIVLPDGTKIRLPADKDPREVFADWLIRPDNPWFTRAIVNRVWAWAIGRGIIHEPDDIREDNPPSNSELLAYLEKELINSDYDLKHLYRLILTSTTYQLSSIPSSDHPEAEANFAAYPLRRLDAEVLIDAINRVTGTTDLYTSAIPEPFTYIPRYHPAISLADGSITSPFLALFGRSARATGMASERDNGTVPAQWLHLLNSSHIQNKLNLGWRIKMLLRSKQAPDKVIEELYLTILSRYPTLEEVEAVADYAKSTDSRYTAAMDTAWALINSPEFLYRH